MINSPLWVLFLVVLWTTATTTTTTVRAQDVDVCVVGAGPAGVQAAYSAEAAGYTTAVFEKESWVGGRTKAVTDSNGGEQHIMGAAIHMSSKSNRLNGLLRKFDLPRPRKANVFGKGYFDIDGNLIRYYPPNPVLMLLHLAKYITRRAVLAVWLNRPDWYLTEYPEDLNKLTLKEWLEKNRMSKLLSVF